MFNLIIATNNKHKITEISHLFGNRHIVLKSLMDFKNFPEIIEDGDSFQENAGIKAQKVFEYLSLPVMADDSGLEVPALNNEPGIYSARYAGADSNYVKNNLLLLEKMRDLNGEARKARFVCTICYKDKTQEKYFTGITEGYILESLQGEGGFGYDPLFYLPQLNKSFAQLTLQEKNNYSHRGKAIRKFLEFLNEESLKCLK